MIRIRTRLERDQGKEEGEEDQTTFGKHVHISAASEESLSSDLGEFVEHCIAPASGESSTTAEEGESGDEEANAKDEVAVEDVIRCK